MATVGHTYGRAGRPDGAERSLATLRRRAEERYVPPAYFALLHASLGRADSALDWLERAVDDRGPEAVWYLGDETLFPELREHPRFVALRDRMGFDTW